MHHDQQQCYIDTSHIPFSRCILFISAHILSTKEYFAFCDRHNEGEYIHHDPSMTDVPARYNLTWKKYVELFGHCPKDLSIWPQCEESESDEYDDYGDLGCG